MFLRTTNSPFFASGTGTSSIPSVGATKGLSVSPRETTSATSNSAPIGWSKNSIKKIIFKYFLRKADKTIVNSIEFKKDLKNEFNVNANCIYNPLDKDEIYKKSKVKYRNFFKSKNKLRILNIGRFTEQKDQITLLKSLYYLKDKIKFEAIIVGKGIEKNNLLNFIKENNLEKHVSILNFLKNPYPIIKQSDLFILSSKYEGLPNVLLEALVLKKVIISSNCRTGPNEILLKYRELTKNANKDENILSNIESQIDVYRLEIANQQEPWELISTPTIEDLRISPKRKQSALITLLLSSIFASFICIIFDRSKNIIFS